LVTLNDIQFVEAARVLASKTLSDPKLKGDINARIQSIANKLIARSFQAEELSVVIASANELLSFYQNNPEQAKQLISVGESKPDAALDVHELAAWTMLINELMNLDEMLTK